MGLQMDWLTFIVETVKAIAWPSVVLFAFVVLRKNIAGLIPFLQRLKYKDLELEFDRQLKEAEAEVADELPPSSAPALLPGVSDTIIELARVSPRAAVTEAWREVEAAAVEAARRNKISLNGERSTSPLRLIRALERAGLVDSDKRALFHDLRNLRNQAVHAPEFALSTEAALDYVSLARRLAEYLRRLGDGKTP
jgi:hypothetical protein